MKILAITVLLFFCNLAFGADPTADEEFGRYTTLMNRISRYSPLTGAGSHGSIGFDAGVGAGVYPSEQSPAILKDQLNSSKAYSQNDNPNVVTPKLFLIKGLSAPVDLGLTGGLVESSKVSSLSAHLQWTM